MPKITIFRSSLKVWAGFAGKALVHRSKRRFQPEFGKIDAKQIVSVLTYEPYECVAPLAPQGLLFLLEHQANRQINKNLTASKTMPDFVDLIDTAPLAKIRGTSVGSER